MCWALFTLGAIVVTPYLIAGLRDYKEFDYPTDYDDMVDYIDKYRTKK